ncbi:hypothetical protein OSB04_un000166 [Centaurea solstitialis]|uniref:Reverse transcriptase zinc-binding domain-containing protein n=1 Tax=Centaurea solstitialis TaxID=347529 RepID=A0AA38SR18_9ASTR|nr:hypothetical protein OSB04_un000166 [Centaurea solstitialis]
MEVKEESQASKSKKEALMSKSKEVGLHGFPEVWSNIVLSLSDNQGPKKLIHKLALSSTVYLIWRERNRRVFNDVKLSPIHLFKQVRELVLSRVASWKLSASQD